MYDRWRGESHDDLHYWMRHSVRLERERLVLFGHFDISQMGKWGLMALVGFSHMGGYDSIPNEWHSNH